MMLAAIGLIFVTRLSPDLGVNQANWISLGTVLLVASAIAGRRYELLRQYKYTAAVLALILLIVTGLMGTTQGGARLWLTVGGLTFQSTEIIKAALIVFLAGYLAQEASVLSMPKVRFGGRTYSSLPYLLPLAGVLGALLLALGMLRDLGTVAILLLLAMAATYVATGLFRYIGVGMALLGVTGLAGYQLFWHAQTRIDIWLNPQSDPTGLGYQTLQSSYAIQAGGVTGEGLGMGHSDLIPAAQTDYIFTAIAEELGLIGALSVVLLFGLLVMVGMRIALMAHDAFGRMLATSTALLFGIQALIIIGGNLRVIPTTGITLPFVSFGGSSLVINMMLVGLMLAIAQRGRSHAQDAQD